MRFWLVITFALILQQGLSTIAVLAHAHQLHYSVILISLVWLVATILEIAGGYFLGKLVRRSFQGSKFERWVEKQAKKLEASIAKSGENIALVLLSAAVSPFVAAFLGCWLDISLAQVFVYTLLGDTLWYASTWAYALGALALISKFKAGLLVISVVAILFVIISHIFKSKTA